MTRKGIFVLLAIAAVARAGPAPEREFLWEEASAQLASAQTPDEFRHAAETYATLIEQGVRNGPLYYNLGTALILADEPDAGLRALRRAERYAGSNWDIRRNMRLATAIKTDDPEATLPWLRVVLFWHYGLSTADRTIVAVIAYAVVWLLLIRRRFTGTVGARFLTALVVLAVFGSSVLASLHQEATDRAHEWRPAPVVVTEGVISP